MNACMVKNRGLPYKAYEVAEDINMYWKFDSVVSVLIGEQNADVEEMPSEARRVTC